MPSREFTRAEILNIRAMAERGASAPEIARLYPEVGLETLRRIIRRETYRDVGVGPTERPRVRAHLADGAVPSPPASVLEAQAAESLARLVAVPTTPAPSPLEGGDPDDGASSVDAFLALRRGLNGTSGPPEGGASLG